MKKSLILISLFSFSLFFSSCSMSAGVGSCCSTSCAKSSSCSKEKSCSSDKGQDSKSCKKNCTKSGCTKK